MCYTCSVEIDLRLKSVPALKGLFIQQAEDADSMLHKRSVSVFWYFVIN